MPLFPRARAARSCRAMSFIPIALALAALAVLAVLAACVVAPPPGSEMLGGGARPDGGAIWPLVPGPDAGGLDPADPWSGEGASAAANAGEDSGETPGAEGPDGSAEGDDCETEGGTPGAEMATPEATGDAPADGGVGEPSEPSMTDPAVTEVADAGGPLPPRAPEAGELVMTELMPDPTQRTDAEGEWVEVWNASPAPLNLATCALGDDAAAGAPFPAVTLAAQATFVIARASMPGFMPDAVLRMSLQNTSDTIVIRCAGEVVDRVAYGPDVELPVAAGVSLSLDPGAWDADRNDDPSAWCRGELDFGGDRGSPGQPNAPCEP